MKTMTLDPVCGMQVDPATSPHSLEHEGVRYAFCCGGCLKAFKANPKPRVAGAPVKRCCCG